MMGREKKRYFGRKKEGGEKGRGVEKKNSLGREGGGGGGGANERGIQSYSQLNFFHYLDASI